MKCITLYGNNMQDSVTEREPCRPRQCRATIYTITSAPSIARRHIHINIETKRVAVRMAPEGVNHKDIRRYTLVSPRSTRRAVELFRRTGQLVRVPLVRGRPRLFNGFDLAVRHQGYSSYLLLTTLTCLQFLESWVERKPDIMLDELRTQLESICGVVTTNWTISRSLRRRGYTRKRVSCDMALSFQTSKRH